MISSILIISAIGFGIGGFWPSPFPGDRLAIGYRAFVGISTLALATFFGVVAFGLGIELTVAAVAIGGIIGLARFIHVAIMNKIPISSFIHPYFAALALVLLTRAYSGPVDYIPIGYDDYSNWLSIAKMMWLENDYWQPGMREIGPTDYIPGWHLMMIFAAGIWGDFQTSYTIGPSTVLQVAVLALAFDTILNWWRNTNNGNELTGRIVAGISVLLILAAEASWLLVPTQIIAEIPLFLTLIGAFCLTTVLWQRHSHTFIVCLSIGIAVGAHNVMKSTGLIAVPAVVFVGVAAAITSKGAGKYWIRLLIVYVLPIALPSLLAILTWRHFGTQTSGVCQNNLVSMLFSRAYVFTEINRGITLAWQLIFTSAIYISSYKIPVLITSLVGLACGLSDRRLRWPSFGVLVFFLGFLCALFLAYFVCADGFMEPMSSLQRYLQIPIRLLHFFGLLVLVCFSTVRINEMLSQFFPDGRMLYILGFAGLAALGGYQTLQIFRSFEEIRTPPARVEILEHIQNFPTDVDIIRKALRVRGIEHGKALLVYRYSSNLPLSIAWNAETPSRRRGDKSVGDEDRFFVFEYYSNEKNYIHPGRKRELTAVWLQQFDVVWPVSNASWIREAVGRITNNSACIESPNAFLIVRDVSGGSSFSCIPRTLPRNE